MGSELPRPFGSMKGSQRLRSAGSSCRSGSGSALLCAGVAGPASRSSALAILCRFELPSRICFERNRQRWHICHCVHHLHHAASQARSRCPSPCNPHSCTARLPACSPPAMDIRHGAEVYRQLRAATPPLPPSSLQGGGVLPPPVPDRGCRHARASSIARSMHAHALRIAQPLAGRTPYGPPLAPGRPPPPIYSLDWDGLRSSRLARWWVGAAADAGGPQAAGRSRSREGRTIHLAPRPGPRRGRGSSRA